MIDKRRGGTPWSAITVSLPSPVITEIPTFALQDLGETGGRFHHEMAVALRRVSRRRVSTLPHSGRGDVGRFAAQRPWRRRPFCRTAAVATSAVPSPRCSANDVRHVLVPLRHRLRGVLTKCVFRHPAGLRGASCRNFTAAVASRFLPARVPGVRRDELLGCPRAHLWSRARPRGPARRHLPSLGGLLPGHMAVMTGITGPGRVRLRG
jgi:hypothetical protein